MQWQIPKHETLELKPKQRAYCVCIPVINEGERIRRELAQMKAVNVSDVLDIIICDGGSVDGSLEKEFLQAMGVRTRLTKTDKGKLSAQLRMGYAYALNEGYKGIVTIDGNNKDNVEALFDFVTELDAGFDLTQGSRYVKGGKAINTPLIRHLAVTCIHAPVISLAAKFRYTDTTNGYRAYSAKFLLDPRVAPFRDIFEGYELLMYLSVRAPELGYKTKEIPVTRAYPKKGKTPTKISFVKGNMNLIKILFNILRNAYDPKGSL